MSPSIVMIAIHHDDFRTGIRNRLGRGFASGRMVSYCGIHIATVYLPAIKSNKNCLGMIERCGI
jgi:hypothetical protein